MNILKMMKYISLIHVQGGKLCFILENNREIISKYVCSSSELNGIPQVPDDIRNVES